MSFDKGSPARLGELIPLNAPELGGNEWTYLKECLDTGWVSAAGPFVDRFESEVAAYVGARNGVAVANGTAGLHVGLRIVGVEPGDEVIVSNLSFIASANAITYCQAVPVFMDVDPATWHIDPAKVGRFLRNECEIRSGQCFNKRTGRRVKAILPVHILGLACEIDRIVELAREFHVKVVEDAAEAMGVRYRGRHPGTFGDVGVFSFNGNKIITSGGGGMVVTGSDSLAKYARYLTTQAKDDPVEYIHRETGFNYRLSNLQAAVGVAQLERIDEFIAKKRAIACSYEAALSSLDGVTLMPVPAGVEPTYWLYTVLMSEGTTLERRREVIRTLNANGVGARPLWHTLHDLPPYQSCEAYEIEHSTALYHRAISLPTSAGLRDEDLAVCIELLRKTLQA